MPQGNETSDFIANISPNFVSVSARNMEDQAHDDNLLEKLHQLKKLVVSVGGQAILQQIDEKKSDLLARNTGFDLVEGGYYRAIAFDYLGHSKPDQYGSKASRY